MSHYEDLNTTKIALVGFISMVVVFAIILLIMFLFHIEMAEQTQLKVVDQPAAEFAGLTADQQGKMAGYRWIDKDKKIVQIPIKQAMDLVVEELRKTPQETPIEKEGGHAP